MTGNDESNSIFPLVTHVLTAKQAIAMWFIGSSESDQLAQLLWAHS